MAKEMAKMTFAEIAERNLKQARHELKQMTEKCESLKADNDKLRSVLDSSGFNHYMCWKKSIVRPDKDYHFVFNKDEFDAFVAVIGVKPNDYFREIIKEKIKED